MADSRPDPERLLAQAQREAARAGRGRLRIWFGAAPGVGKTFAMLTASRRLAAEGRDVVLGLVEAHGRQATQALLAGLELLPRRRVDYRGATLEEFDLDAALVRKPAVLVVDELAHSNAPGSRFGKRWQDVQALLAAGIDVLTTLNVQHLESLVDVVAQITGVTVRETVPDSVLADADEVELVDLPPDALRERLRQGLVYVPATAAAAGEAFFRKGNLTALRELALRRTAQWVDGQLQRYKEEHGVQRIWRAGERMLVCVGPSPQSAQLVRAAHRAATLAHAEWFAVHVETPTDTAGLGTADRERVVQHLLLAQSLGARTATLEAADAAAAVVAWARAHNVGRIVVGKSGRSPWHERWFGSFPMRLIRLSDDIEVHAVRVDGAAEPGAPGVVGTALERARPYLLALGCTGVAAAAAAALYAPPDLSVEALVLTLGVALAAVFTGTGPSVVAAVVAVLTFNFLFTEPRFSFAVADPGNVVALVVLLLVGLGLATLLRGMRLRAAAALAHQQGSAALFSLVRELADVGSADEVARITVGHLRDVVAADVAVLLPAGSGPGVELLVAASFGAPDWLQPDELAVARWCWDHGRPAGVGTVNLPGAAALHLPLAGGEGRIAVLSLRPAPGTSPSPQQRLVVQALAEQAVLAFERVRLQQSRRQAEQEAARERLRSTLLASVSHDLRTPLATITGAASSLCDPTAAHSEASRQELLHGILAEARRLDSLVANLMAATRLEAGAVQLRREWTSLEEVVGAALHRAAALLEGHRVVVALAPHLPLLQADPVLLEQALHNLLANAARHTPVGTTVTVRAAVADRMLTLEVGDDGPGLGDVDPAHVLERFTRGRHSPGMGLGLSIVDGIVRAHGGRTEVLPATPHGVVFRLALPLPVQPPAPPPEAAEGGAA